MTLDNLWRQAMDALHAARQRADAAWRNGDSDLNEANLALIEAKEAALSAYNAAKEKPE